MAKSDLRARPGFHTVKASIEAYLTVVMAAVAVDRWLESASGWSLKRLVQTLRGYQEMLTNVDGHEAVAILPLLPELIDVMSDIQAKADAKPS